jgi:hypothetical protein
MTSTPVDRKSKYDQEANRLAQVLGFQVVQVEQDFQMQFMHFVEVDGKQTFVPRSVRPCQQWEWLLWQQAVTSRLDHNNAAKLSWDLYSAAMGVTIRNFAGLPGNSPVEVVTNERASLLDLAQAALSLRDAAAQDLRKLIKFLVQHDVAIHKDVSPADIAIEHMKMLRESLATAKQHIEADHETLRQKQQLIDERLNGD